MAARKVLITCAVTGAVHTPSMTPHLPVTADHIANSAIDAAKAGAAIVHLRARNPETGEPDQSPERFAPIIHAIREQSDCVINITTGGAPTMSLDERLAPALQFEPELASLNMGSMNFGLFAAASRVTSFLHGWERPYLEGSRGRVFRNTFADIEHILSVGAERGIRFECECYDIGHLYTLAHFVDRGLIRPPLFVQMVFGILGGIGAHPEDVGAMRRTADRLFGREYEWSVLGAGRHRLTVAALSASMGGHVRVGLEDSIWLWPGQLAESNAQQVAQARTLIESLGLEVATPSDARTLLSLKGSSVTA